MFRNLNEQILAKLPWLERRCGHAFVSTCPLPHIMHMESENRLHLRNGTAAAAAKLLQSCQTLCDPIDGSPPGSSVSGILQTRTLEWCCHFLLQCMKVKSENEDAQSCLTLSDSMDCSLPGSSVHGIFQARVLEWGAIAFSKKWY